MSCWWVDVAGDRWVGVHGQPDRAQEAVSPGERSVAVRLLDLYTAGQGLVHCSSGRLLRRSCSDACEGGTRRLLADLSVAVRQGVSLPGCRRRRLLPDIRLLRGFLWVPGRSGCWPPWDLGSAARKHWLLRFDGVRRRTRAGELDGNNGNIWQNTGTRFR